jgi:hypothetical protein
VITLRDGDAGWDGRCTNDPYAGDGLGIAPGVVSMFFARAAGKTPIVIELHDSAPGNDDIEDYDGTTEASLALPSGRLVLESECDQDEVKLAPGTYRARVYYGNEDTCHYDDEDGANHVRVALFPGIDTPLQVLNPKQKNGDAPVEQYRGGRNEQELMQMLSSISNSHRCLATVALLRLGRLDLAKAAAADAAASVRSVFASALWFAGSDAESPLLEIAQGEDAELRLRAAQSLGMLASPGAESVLQHLQDDPDNNVRRVAESALEDWQQRRRRR